MLAIYGPPGIGKSTIGATLAHMEGKTHIDTDQVFVEQYGDISQFIKNHGIALLREKEGAILSQYLNTGDIVTLGGGTLLRPENQELANQSGKLITLMTDIETIVARIMSDTYNHRPLAISEDDIRNLYNERYSHYMSESVVLHIDPKETPEDITNRIISLTKIVSTPSLASRSPSISVRSLVDRSML